jgi:hypothetical protein
MKLEANADYTIDGFPGATFKASANGEFLITHMGPCPMSPDGTTLYTPMGPYPEHIIHKKEVQCIN